ncbi:hypothetical protein AJ85_20750 [Alkalihalobacillus alcalophilus ATCC 27647 = CGMCC 1.3604]|uniref:PPM-type phosphatase domain-containing protein n=1 Tax=Alkalihalobacillus alcalophilus ATCC 27647 = CGMCC 1.3604 TaxID=1218173 RepID=A0A094WLW6_ALKAL|nr:protein phosphatase 2C domain-containing protein [Alkalihalobacillus alcalophilus]KGA96948.1 hypothetical protein BALCAV_0213065 [Alkalihalobacillus alcalophilus ATCC 27647 = CGMCC 1.3604]MED1561353.1 protein phosphatase 2C domain-containing protein [Alkalihalobacillus alcalophilus]THG88888.1 hypothetical protein AJ85_20750 [Alkalihalobacillus alcalophilus ATCC 27647 = CGMCC 1.3604]
MTFNENWQIGLATHTGPVKDRNEDNYFLRMTLDPKGQEFGVLAIADGMGGYQDGAEASKLVVKKLDSWWLKRVPKLLKKKNLQQHLSSEFEKLFVQMNQELLQIGSKLGTTLSLIVMYGGHYQLYHVGDSRIYQVKGSQGFQRFIHQQQQHDISLAEQLTEELEGEIEMALLTEDHSWVEQQVKKGKLTREQARNHRKRNMLTQCLGIEEHVDPFEQVGFYHSSDLFLLCSDGFYSMFSDEEIIMTLQGLEKEYTDLQLIADYLVKLANFSGTRDNITVLLVRNVFAKDQVTESEQKSFLQSLFSRTKRGTP